MITKALLDLVCVPLRWFVILAWLPMMVIAAVVSRIGESAGDLIAASDDMRFPLGWITCRRTRNCVRELGSQMKKYRAALGRTLNDLDDLQGDPAEIQRIKDRISSDLA